MVFRVSVDGRSVFVPGWPAISFRMCFMETPTVTRYVPERLNDEIVILHRFVRVHERVSDSVSVSVNVHVDVNVHVLVDA